MLNIRSSWCVAALAAVLLCNPVVAQGKPARPAPPLPAPTGTIITVNTEAALQNAVRTLTSNTTIVIAPGTYVLTSTLYVKGPLSNVTLRGASDDAGAVVLVGPGMNRADYGAVPFGIWTGFGVDGITIANLTIRDIYYHPIILNPPTQRPRIYNVHLIDAGQQFVKVNPGSTSINDGILEYSIVEFTTTARDTYPEGIDIHAGANWIIRHNLFRNIVAPDGAIAGPAVLSWRGASNTITEGNTFINCSRGVMYGVSDYLTPSHRGGIIRNNMFYRASHQPGDVGIMLTDSPGSHILNNTVLTSGTYPNAIEYRYASTQGGLIVNNLVDGVIQARNGATATVRRNLENTGRHLLADANGADLHLAASASIAIDQGEPLVDVTEDWDGQSRLAGLSYDIGADEHSQTSVAFAISGRVTDAVTGAGVPGVAITLSGAASLTAYTDGSGAYAFSGLTPGLRYLITPSQAAFTFAPASTEVPALTRQEQAVFIRSAAARVGASVTFLGVDTTTQGAWRGRYGSQGYVLADDAANPPAGVEIGVSAASPWTWSSLTTDLRALERGGSASRFAASWYGNGAFSINVNATDNQPHRIALYLLDWDAQGRAQKIDVLDAATGTLLETRSAVGFSAGQYFAWTIRGHVVFSVTPIGGPNGVVSAVFVDPGSSAPVVSVTSAQQVGNNLDVGWSLPSGVTATAHRLDFYQASTLVATVNGGSATSISIPLPAGIQGAFAVRVTALNGTAAAPTSEPFAFTLGCAGAPAAPVVSGGVVNGNGWVSWPAVAGASSYTFSVGTSPAAADYVPPSNTTSTTLSASGLPPGFQAWVRVVANNACGASVATDFLAR